VIGEDAWARRRRWGLGGLLVVTGLLHFAVPRIYDDIIPSVLPGRWARPLVYVSGAAELAGGGLLLAAPSPAVGWFVAVLLVAIFPANVQMAIDTPNAVTLGRLPLQVPLVWAAVRVARPARPHA
jgi:uncharacterized membrane protein